MSKKYQVTYKNHLNDDGLTFEYPTDCFQSGGVELETFEFVKSTIKRGDNFAREVWQYEVSNEDTSSFESALDRMFSENDCVLVWKRVR